MIVRLNGKLMPMKVQCSSSRNNVITVGWQVDQRYLRLLLHDCITAIQQVQEPVTVPLGLK
jgi:hypothetical protein